MPADTYTGIKMSMFRTSLNIGRTGHTGRFQALSACTEKSFFFLFSFFSFVIFEMTKW